MSNLTRKDFIRLSSWGIVASLLPFQKIQALSSILSEKKETTNEDFNTAIELAKNARHSFYNREYDRAEELYLQCISLASAAICFYDGLDNVYGAQNRILESVELYKNGLLNNPNKISFYDRAARSLMRLETGNKKQALNYKNRINSSSLLADASVLYQSALLIDNTKNYLNIGQAKITSKINIAPLEANFKVNKVFKNLKHVRKNSYKAALNNKTNDELKALIEKIDLKKRRELFKLEEIEERKRNITIQKKKFYEILQKRESLNTTEKIENFEKLFNIDVKDPKSFRKLKVIYYTNNRIFEFIEIRKKFAEASKNFYANLGLMDTMELAYKKGQASNETLNQAIEVGLNLKNNWSISFQKEVEVVIKISKIFLLQSKFDEAKNLLENTMEKVKTDSLSINNKLLLYYAKIYFQENKLEIAKNILLIGTKEIDKESVSKIIEENEKLTLVNQLSNNKEKDEFKNNISLFYLLHNVYLSLNEIEKASDVLKRIRNNNPLDSFVQVRT